MTPSELKANIRKHDLDSHFFDRKTMKFFGDTMRNYGVRRAEIITYGDPLPVEVWELYRKKPVRRGIKSSAFFRVSDFQQVLKRGL